MSNPLDEIIAAIDDLRVNDTCTREYRRESARRLLKAIRSALATPNAARLTDDEAGRPDETHA